MTMLGKRKYVSCQLEVKMWGPWQELVGVLPLLLIFGIFFILIERWETWRARNLDKGARFQWQKEMRAFSALFSFFIFVQKKWQLSRAFRSLVTTLENMLFIKQHGQCYPQKSKLLPLHCCSLNHVPDIFMFWFPKKFSIVTKDAKGYPWSRESWVPQAPEEPPKKRTFGASMEDEQLSSSLTWRQRIPNHPCCAGHCSSLSTAASERGLPWLI